MRSSAGLVFQNPDDQIVSSVIENDVAFGPENLGVEQENLREVVTRSLAAVGLAGCEKRETATLSGGSEAARRHRGRAGHGSGYPHPGRGDRDARPRRQRSRDEHMREASRARDDRGHDHALHGRGGARRPGRRHRPGEIALDGTPEDILTRADELMKLSLEMPFASELACRLRQLGVPVSATVSADELEEELCRLLSRA